MSLGRHARHYLLIGGVQWLVDWGVMVLLSHYGPVHQPLHAADDQVMAGVSAKAHRISRAWGMAAS